MTILERLLGHDEASTRELLELCLPLTDAEFDREFDAGWRTLRATFEHMLFNIEIWTDLMLARPLRDIKGQNSPQELLARLQTNYAEFAAFARRIEAEGHLNEKWTDTLDSPPQQKTFGGAIAHVITHNMHHRAELQHMLHRLPLVNVPEGDLMGWEMLTHG